MKFLLLLFLFCVAIGATSSRLGFRQVFILAGGIGLVVAWQTFNIVFRYIPVE